ncbi:MAG: hypothetical protein ACLRFL_00315 [Clostridia bacterium]
MRRQNNEMYQNAMKVAKRIAITIICCVPIMIAFGYLTRNIITNSAVQIICFMIIMSVAVVIVELIAKRQAQKREAKKLLHEDKDVFK